MSSLPGRLQAFGSRSGCDMVMTFASISLTLIGRSCSDHSCMRSGECSRSAVGAGSLSTASVYVRSVRYFWSYLADHHPNLRRLQDVEPEHLDGFATWMRDGRRSEISAYQILGKVIGCLRLAHEDQPGAIPARTLTRLRRIIDHYPGSGRPRDAYDARITAAMREGSRRDVLSIHHRIVVGGAAVLRGESIEGDDRIQAAYRAVLEQIEQDGTIGCMHPTYRYLYFWRREAGLSNGALIDDLHGHFHLSHFDVISFLVLLSLETGIEIECCKDLTANCLKNPAAGSVDIDYCKRRARGAEWRRLRVRDGSSGTPGGLLRMALRLTARARRQLGSDSLWCYVMRGQLVAGIGHPRHSALATFVDRHGIVGDDGQPLRLVLSRLRKTHKAEWYRRTDGQMEQFAIGHTAEIAANHYADIPALRPLHEEAVAAGLQDALDATIIPRIVTPAEEARMRAAPATADLPVPPAEVAAFLSGSQDLWLASCGGFYNSPFGAKGDACPVPFWGCLECSNAVITARKLPSLIAFMVFMVSQRNSLAAADWAAKFDRAYRRIADQILPAFPAAIVAAARSIAESQAGLIHLPPEASAA